MLSVENKMEVGYNDVMGNMGNANANSMFTNQNMAPEMTTQQIIDEAKLRTPEGGDYVDTLLQYVVKNNIPFEEADRMLGLPAGSTASYNTQKIVDEAKLRTPEGGNYVDTLYNYAMENNIPFDEADNLLGLPAGSTERYHQGKQTRGFESPKVPDLSNLFGSLQDIRDVNKDSMFAPRTDLTALRKSIYDDYAAADKAEEEEAIKKAAEAAGITSFDYGRSAGDYTGLSKEQIAFLEAESPDERDYRMRQISQYLTPNFVKALDSQFGTYNSSYGTSTPNRSLSSETQAGLAAAQSSFGYGSNRDYFGD